MNEEPKKQDAGPGPSMLLTRVVQVLGVFAGVAVTVWTFLYLFGLSMEYDNAEKATAIIPALGLLAYLYGRRRNSPAYCRWGLLEFFTGSLASYLLMQFIIVRLI